MAKNISVLSDDYDRYAEKAEQQRVLVEQIRKEVQAFNDCVNQLEQCFFAMEAYFTDPFSDAVADKFRKEVLPSKEKILHLAEWVATCVENIIDCPPPRWAMNRLSY